jgi:hypothetical protein
MGEFMVNYKIINHLIGLTKTIMHKKFLRTSAVMLMCATSGWTATQAMDEDKPLLSGGKNLTYSPGKYATWFHEHLNEIEIAIDCKPGKQIKHISPGREVYGSERIYVGESENSQGITTHYKTNQWKSKTPDTEWYTTECSQCKNTMTTISLWYVTTYNLNLKRDEKKHHLIIRRADKQPSYRKRVEPRPCRKPYLNGTLKEIWDEAYPNSCNDSWDETILRLGNKAMSLDKDYRWEFVYEEKSWCSAHCCSIL